MLSDLLSIGIEDSERRPEFDTAELIEASHLELT
jgi:hypothetical protein